MRALGAAIAANVALYRHDVHFDATREGQNTPPRQLTDVVKALRSPLSLTYFYNASDPNALGVRDMIEIAARNHPLLAFRAIDLDKEPGYYLRLDWRPPAPFDLNVFYYDNRGDPEAFFPKTLQWGWRTRFWNVGLSADLGPNTKLLAQGMSGSTIMGFKEANGQPWVHTYFRSAYALIAQRLDDKTQVTGRVEAFGTREHGSEMSPALNDEDGWALTVAVRHTFSPHLTGFLEALNVRSRRGMRSVLGTDPFQPQTVFQAALRFRL